MPFAVMVSSALGWKRKYQNTKPGIPQMSIPPDAIRDAETYLLSHASQLSAPTGLLLLTGPILVLLARHIFQALRLLVPVLGAKREHGVEVDDMLQEDVEEEDGLQVLGAVGIVAQERTIAVGVAAEVVQREEEAEAGIAADQGQPGDEVDDRHPGSQGAGNLLARQRRVALVELVDAGLLQGQNRVEGRHVASARPPNQPRKLAARPLGLNADLGQGMTLPEDFVTVVLHPASREVVVPGDAANAEVDLVAEAVLEMAVLQDAGPHGHAGAGQGDDAAIRSEAGLHGAVEAVGDTGRKALPDGDVLGVGVAGTDAKSSQSLSESTFL